MLIKKNTHRSGLNFDFVRKNRGLVYDVTFTESCKYNTWREDTSVHKIFGIGFLPYHRWRSIRFGWTYHGGDLVLVHSYIYDNGRRTIEPMVWVPIGSSTSMSIIPGPDGGYTMRAAHVVKHIDIRPKWGYKLWPYFGGQNVAPHDIKINLENIK